ncbi:hypothetical protein ACQSDP_06595 [Salmonella enterica]
MPGDALNAADEPLSGCAQTWRGGKIIRRSPPVWRERTGSIQDGPGWRLDTYRSEVNVQLYGDTTGNLPEKCGMFTGCCLR